ncbi:MAG: Prophage antirepressor [Candidatus Collierbacteria bacterium GW2011_GWB1_45_35]|uniref:Prophage antirepressor n=2 Tax=Candidatus Collieribacteriota TaxID=1752725 RepID=A0A0G1KSH7_9BACT|nr:MAG: Prophage antirepressor [Microgenomates group bacterium GW2011_GWC1_44_23]KKT86528.1 MAG: Prophage antirepressor [Candidatus Collierbacteria bacterium GW2011_GWA2_44_99]KKT96052.1 MAG: Prophage antirepressor [Candidatus Collierbacteria bacterium GW2011_GWA1_45_15]KKU01074.1 MAG: Prophage antirepressor [Candidatus Collierbacteria bacterium GW2011_GWB2_45_17]KKU05684.1 MAG: Prophage antirepressor [Candidatus Collierbacteria bacterium GW2011_GWB1_45_35]KKU07967.1 MAG: Prophage antirepresso
MPKKIIDPTRIAIFQKKEIRKTIYKNEWYFSVIDVIAALTESVNPRDYWFKMKIRVNSEDGAELSTICRQLKMKSADGKLYLTDCSNTEGIFRIIQSIPSPKAEPFKRWLAKVGYERIQEIEDPELAQKRARAIYKAKGYPDGWIEKRMRSIAIREDLTEQWDIHGVKLQKEYAILTAEISQAAFGVTPSQHKKIKGLERQNLRDHMSDLELLFSMLGEASTTEITKTEHPSGFIENKRVSRRGGKIAGGAREKLEKEIGKSIVTPKNFLPKLPKKLKSEN